MGAACPATIDILDAMLHISIDRDGGTPPYQQVAEWIISEIRAGRYGRDQKLPSVDDLIEAAGIAERTARKALIVVRDAGYARLQPGMGYYVPDVLPGHDGGT